MDRQNKLSKSELGGTPKDQENHETILGKLSGSFGVSADGMMLASLSGSAFTWGFVSVKESKTLFRSINRTPAGALMGVGSYGLYCTFMSSEASVLRWWKGFRPEKSEPTFFSSWWK